MSSVDPRPSSPCVKICVVDPLSGLCIGCGRNVEEIASWSELGERERLAVMATLAQRLAEARQRSQRSGRVGRGAPRPWA